MDMETLSLFDVMQQESALTNPELSDSRAPSTGMEVQEDLPVAPEPSYPRNRESLPAEHTLSADDRWAYPGGNFGIRLSQNFLEDPRMRDLSLKALGIYIILRASWEAGRPVPAKSKDAAKIFGMTPAAWTNCFDELSICCPALIEVRQGYVLPTSFGKPIQRGLSEVRALAAHARHERLKETAGTYRDPEVQVGSAPADEVIPDSQENDLFGKVPIELSKTPCPFSEIMLLFVTHCPSLPKPTEFKGWPATRKKRVGDIWKKNPTLEFWTTFFQAVESSDWLCGRGSKSNGWKASFDWITQPANMLKIREGNFSTNAAPNMFQGGRFNVGSYGNHEIDTSASWLQPDSGGDHSNEGN